jgi:hypothetical protein
MRMDRARISDGLRAQVDALDAALIQADGNSEYDTVQLRDAVASVARAARDEHVPPERLLVLLKRRTRDVVPRHLSQWRRDDLTDRFVRWGIEAYYALPGIQRARTNR